MKKVALLMVAAMATSLVSAESILKPVNDKGYGTISGRVQSLTMYRDYEGVGNGANSTLGFILGYTSPELAGFDAGLAYNNAAELDNNNNSGMLANDDINILNEGWLRYNFGALNCPGTTVLAGRKINNGEVFRADDYRQKSRSIEAVQIETDAVPDARLAVGHAIQLSNWLDAGDKWNFNDFGEIFGKDYDSDGVTWAEGVYTGISGWEIALFDAYAWDVTNLIGTRTQWQVNESSALVGYYRHESDVGMADPRNSNAYGVSLKQKVGNVTVEPGYFGVHGSSLHFQEATTGINHPLGATMMLYSGQFNGGADSLYLKATTKIGKTSLYGIYNYAWQKHSKTAFDGQELNLVVKQEIIENLSVSVKGGLGYHDMKDGSGDRTATDGRLFLTYTF